MGEALPKYDETKADFLRWLGKADALVDDNENNTRAVDETGVKTILFPRPWNGSRLSVRETLDVLTETASTSTRTEGGRS